MCCKWLCAQLCAFLSSLVILVFDFADFAIGTVLLYESLGPTSERSYVLGAPATTIVASYGAALIVLAGASCLGVGLKWKWCLIFASVLAVLGFLCEVGVAGVVVLDAKLPPRLGLEIPTAWALMLAAASCRHVLRLVFSKALGASRDVFVALRSERRAVEDSERREQLSERLLARRSEHEEMRHHFNTKYFNGKTSAGEPTPPRDEHSSTELPSFLITKKRRGAADDGDSPVSFEV